MIQVTKQSSNTLFIKSFDETFLFGGEIVGCGLPAEPIYQCKFGLFNPDGYLIFDVPFNTPFSEMNQSSLRFHAIDEYGCNESVLKAGSYTIRAFHDDELPGGAWDCTEPSLEFARNSIISGGETGIVYEINSPIASGLNIILIAFIIFGFSKLITELFKKW